MTHKLPVSTSVLCPLVNRELEKAGYGTVSRQWVREFTAKMNMSYRKQVLRESLKFTVEQIADVQGNVREKLVWLMDFWKVLEFTVFFCPLDSKCWCILDSKCWNLQYFFCTLALLRFRLSAATTMTKPLGFAGSDGRQNTVYSRIGDSDGLGSAMVQSHHIYIYI